MASSRRLNGHGRFWPSKDNLSWGMLRLGWKERLGVRTRIPFFPVLPLSTVVSTTLSLALVGGDIICEDFSPLYIWVSDRMVLILLRVTMLFPCPNGHVMAKVVWSLFGMLCGKWDPAILPMVRHTLNLLAKPFFWVGHVA